MDMTYYFEGKEAFYAGEKMKDYPYDKNDTVAYASWKRGWKDAKEVG